MVRNLVGFLGLLVAIGHAAQPAEAGDRKSTGQVETKAILVAPAAPAPATANARPGTSTVGFFEKGYSASPTRGSGREKEKAARDRNDLTLFHFNSKFGEVAVRPVFGKVNGAQVTVGF